MMSGSTNNSSTPRLRDNIDYNELNKISILYFSIGALIGLAYGLPLAIACGLMLCYLMFYRGD